MTGSATVLATLGDDVAAALRPLGVAPAAAARITGLPSRVSERATFRIVLADGRIVKARRLSRAAKADRFAAVVRGLRHARLPAVLAVVGRVTVEEWVDGIPLSALPLSAERLAQAAAILGALHATETLDGRRTHVRAPTRTVHGRARRQLARLATDGLLARELADVLIDELDRSVPAEAETGLTHNDLCAANMVEDPLGRLFVVDNEGLRYGFLDFDLARTWYRWRMPRAAWQAFLADYAAWRAPDIHSAHASFWRIAAVAKSAHLRAARASARAGVPLRRLRALAAEAEGAAR